MKHLQFLQTILPVLQAHDFTLYAFGTAPEDPGARWATWQGLPSPTSQTYDLRYLDDVRIQLNVSALRSAEDQQAMSDLWSAISSTPALRRTSAPRPLTPTEDSPYDTWTADFRVL